MYQQPIGVFDSGMGGVSILKGLTKRFPNEKFIYYYDSKNLPYGEKSEEEVKRIIIGNVNYLLSLNVKAIIIACNTGSCVALEYLKENIKVPVFGIIPPIKDLLRASKKKVLVLGTHLTLNSKKYLELIKELDKSKRIISVPMSDYVELVEDLNFSYTDFKKYTEGQLKGIDLNEVDVISLSCTHFNFLKKNFMKLFPDKLIYNSTNKLIMSLKVFIKG